MTITYQKNVSNTSFMGFAKLLVKWRGSIYKLIFKEMMMYAGAYAIISICYRKYMNEAQRRKFEKLAMYCDQTVGLMPMSFVLGFYVSFVVSRWWNQFLNLPWPDRVAHTLIMYVNGGDERGRMLRRTMIRYINLATVIPLPDNQCFCKETVSHHDTSHRSSLKLLGTSLGLMTSEEKQMFESIKLTVNKHWIPFIWFVNLTNAAVKEGRIQSGEPVKQILEELNNVRTKTGHLWGHDWVTVPLVYTQVVTLMTHLFFITCLIGRQFLDPSQGYKGHDIDLYFPIYTFIQFFFFLGWLKVAEQLINPFGEDDDDFETNWFIDRNIQVSYTIVDEMYGKLAKMERDLHWGRGGSVDLPYTEAAIVHKIPDYKGSTMNMVVPMREQTMVFASVEDPPPEWDRKPAFLEKVLSRYCCCCMPPLNKPLGESYGRPERFNFEQYDASKRRESNYSIFGDYFSIINKKERDSVTSFGQQNTSETTSLTVPNSVYIRRHRPSLGVNQVLTSVSENEQEENDSERAGKNLPGNDSVKLALAFLDEDLEDIEEDK